MKDLYLSVVIPSYNETENLQRGVLAEVANYLKRQKYSWEVIVVDDESPDPEARKLAKDFCSANPGFVFIQAKHGGKAMSIYQGVKESKGKIILFTDMDQSAPISELEKLLPKFDEGYDVVIGSRGLERKNFSPLRKLASFIFRNFRNIILASNIVDTQAGFKAFRSEVAKEIFPALSVIKRSGAAQGWTVGAFDVEFLVIARMRGYKIAEVFIKWEDRDESVAKAQERRQGKFIKESVDMAKEVLRVKYNQTMGYYKR